MRITAICVLLTFSYPLAAQLNSSNAKGIQIITSGGKAADSLFNSLLCGRDAIVILIPTAASNLRSNAGTIWNPDEYQYKEAYLYDLLQRFNLDTISVLHTRSREEANTENFVAPLRNAQAVWISGGNPGRFISTYQGTLLEKELNAILQRGGIIVRESIGESANSIVQGSYTIRGNSNKLVLMVEGSEKGIGLIQSVANNAHPSAQKRQNKLISIIDKYTYLLGIGIDYNTGFIIQDGIGDVFGSGRIAIYDNKKHKEGRYYWLKPGDKFDFNKKSPIKILPESH
ncbi:MAG TPA: Type 1 glutamine amidotransferase-like domain-containing protein [Chryseolinea sp.]|nr:Type 1 glutamine amidotransferase-like domain-containing protein [Chryseolinea sp.]HPM29831.1 Type 1 glutamine amidotransferase-like domain-containing protein [Chryseolinea sp.]